MTCPTILVHLAPGRSNSSLLKVAGDLIDQFHCNALGVAVCRAFDPNPGELLRRHDVPQAERDVMDRELIRAESEFRSALQPHAVPLDWRIHITRESIADIVAAESRAADILLTNPSSRDQTDKLRRADTGDLVIRAGRPVMVAPEGLEKLDIGKVLIAWKNTAQARRAVLDSLQIVKLASEVSIVTIAAEAQLATAKAEMLDVSFWLKSHGVIAEPIAAVTAGDDAASLKAICLERGAGLVVAGAYGHSQIRERAVGGVTRDLLLAANCCSFISH